MTERTLLQLASNAGVATSWKDVFGQVHTVTPPTLEAVLNALGYPARSDAQIQDSYIRATSKNRRLPPLVTGQQGLPIELPTDPARYILRLEDGRTIEGYAEPHRSGSIIPPIIEPGYHRLEFDNFMTTLAMAPTRCFSAQEALRSRKGWGLALQLYALRRRGDAGIGDFAALAELAPHAARLGAQAIAISPVHAQFTADPDRYAPYAPSSRTALNILHIALDVSELELEGCQLIDWPKAARYKLRHLRTQFAEQKNSSQMSSLTKFRHAGGESLQGHVVFEALQEYFLQNNSELWHWRTWPAEFRDSQSTAVQRFAHEHSDSIEFHAWLQFRADIELAAAQAACRQSGMAIGLISDLAVGADSGGSQCWSRQRETLLGLTVGAPPDLLQRHGQNWGLTAFSPPGLIESGFAAYVNMLRAALAHAGGMRIDHAMGLNRLWVIPEGGSGADGAYLSFPERDLLALIRLESWRHRAVVLAEDLGTVPDGFRERLYDAGIEGMRVLWFERDKDDAFVPPEQWTERAVAMTSTHDLPTLAGWWSGRDLDWQDRMGHLPDVPASRRERAEDRARLWNALRQSGATNEDAPQPDDSAEFVAAACAHIGGTACELVILPLEDALGLVEQPNVPGTTSEHPNWRRRLPADSPETLLDEAASARLRRLDDARKL